MGFCSSDNSEYHRPDFFITNVKPTLNDEQGGHLSENMEFNGVGGGIHFQPFGVGFSSSCSNFSGDEILKLFNLLSALKFAYLQFQKAHIPYEPKKISVADELIVTQLEALCKAKRAFKQNNFNAVESKRRLQYDALKERVKCKERLLQELKSKLEVQNLEALCLQQRLHDLDSRNEMLAGKKANSSSINAFEEAFNATYKSIHDFAKPLIALMKASGWDLDAAANSIGKAVVYTKRSDKKYAFEAYIARRMFHEMSYEQCSIEDVERFDDPIDFLLMYPKSEFAKFCRSKYLLIVHPLMEASFFGNLDHRTLVQCGKHPRTLFYHIFAKLAKWVWILQGVATSTNPTAEPFVVRRESKFSDTFMESIKGDGDV